MNWFPQYILIHYVLGACEKVVTADSVNNPKIKINFFPDKPGLTLNFNMISYC